MMEYPLTLAFILRRAETLFGHKAIITRRPDKTIHRYTYADFVPRAKKLAVALRQLGLRRGDRVATLCWNQYEHVEAYFGVPLAGPAQSRTGVRRGWRAGVRRRPARRAHVPRQRLGPAVYLHDDRSDAGPPWAAPRCGEPLRVVRRRARHVHRGRPDDLARAPA